MAILITKGIWNVLRHPLKKWKQSFGLLTVLVMIAVGVFTQPNSVAAAACSSSGNNVTISVNCEFAAGTYFFTGTFTVNAGVTVTAQGNTGAGTGVVIVSDNMTINGTIEADADGYLGGNGGAATGDGPGGGTGSSGFAFGASHGGRGSSNNTLGEYGSLYAPILLGSGGGDDNETGAGGTGGGAIKLFLYNSGTITFGNGAILSADSGISGAADQGGGSGGSIWIDAPNGTVTIGGGDAATVRARGGTTGGKDIDGGGGTSDGGGAGGGGRIAIYAGTCTNCGNISFDARGGLQGAQSGAYPEGGAGSIFKKLNGATNGDLIFKNNNFVGAEETTLVASSTNIIDNLTIADGAEVHIPSSIDVEIASGGTLTGGGTDQPILNILTGGSFDTGAATFTFNDLDITNSGDIDTVTSLTVTDAIFTHGATADFPAGVTSHSLTSAAVFNDDGGGGLNITSLTVVAGTTYVLNDDDYYPWASNFGAMSVSGTFTSERLATTFVETLTVLSGGIVDHGNNTTAHLYSLNMSATSTIDVQSGGFIRADFLGYDGDNGPGKGNNDTTSTQASGGGHGGTGGQNANVGGTAYGSVSQPITMGSGGGNDSGGDDYGGEGGGVIKLVAGTTLTVNGTIESDGDTLLSTADDAGGGAGGSIWLDAATVTGSGTVRAVGGAGYNADYGGGGGGGRIAAYYDTDSSSITWNAGAGQSDDTCYNSYSKCHGGAGTVYLKDNAETYAELIIDSNTSVLKNNTTPQINASETYKNITITDGAVYEIGSSETLVLDTGGTLTGGGALQSKIKILSGGTFTPPTSTYTFNDVDVDNSGVIDTVTNLLVTDATFTNNVDLSIVTSLTLSGATFTHNPAADFGSGLTTFSLSTSTFNDEGGGGMDITSLTVPSGSTYILNDEDYYPWAEGFGAMSVAGTFTAERLGTIFVETFTVPSGGIVNHGDNSSALLYKVDISATSTIDVQSGGFIRVDEFGYDSELGAGAGNNNSGVNEGSGGGHGGTGGANLNAGGVANDSVSQPVDMGSGGGNDASSGSYIGGSGGGVVKLVAGTTLTVNGSIESDGESTLSTRDDAGAGAGGAIWLDADTLAGSGTIQAIGGAGYNADYGGGGGGGRIAAYYDTDSSSITWNARGGFSDNTCFDQSNRQRCHGGAGTVYLKDNAETYADLIIDNNDTNDRSNSTDQLNASETYKSVTLADGALYEVESGETLTIITTFSNSGSIQPNFEIQSGGTVDFPAGISSFSGLDLIHDGTITDTTATLTYTDGDMDLGTGTFTTPITNLTVGGTGTTAWNQESGTSLDFGVLTLGSGATWTQTSTTSPASTSLTIESGGTFTQNHTSSISINAITIESGGNLTHTANTTTKAYVLDLSVSTIDVQSGGAINVSNKGFQQSEDATQGGDDGSCGGGGGHGGAGGSGCAGTDPGGAAAGDASAPITIGGGGGNDGSSPGGDGGGAIKLTISTSATINGDVSANGEITPNNNDAGGGAGGSIWFNMSSATLAGSGTVTADGGDARTTQGGGGGGGGRIYVSFSSDSSTITRTVTGGLKGNQSGFEGTDGAVGTLTWLSDAPVVDSVTHSPSVPEVGDEIFLSCDASKSPEGIEKIEIFMDGTTGGDLQKTCNYSPTETPANCNVTIGSLSAGAHTTTCRAKSTAATTTDDTDAFTVINRTTGNSAELGSTKISESSVGILSMTFAEASTGTLTVTFPAGFTVTAAATDAQSDNCFTGFGFTSSTLTATKTSCSGTVQFGGFTVTNPSTAGQYLITWSNDTGAALVTIVDDDQFNVSASVNPTISFNIGSQAAATACDGTFSGNGGAVAFGTIAPSAVSSSDASSVAHVCLRFSTNASGGAVVTVLSTNASLKSAGTPTDTVPSSTATLVGGTEGYGVCVGSAGGDTGIDTTTPTGASVAAASPFNATCTSSDHGVGAVTTSSQNVVTVSGAVQNAFARVYLKTAISPTTEPHDDYADTLTFILTATY